MAKLVKVKQGKYIKAYRINLKKSEIEKRNLQEAQFNIEYNDNSIIILKDKEERK